jgi:hypothetical protein
VKLASFDHPLVFLLAIFLGVVAMFALSRAVFSALGWTGPLGLVTMGTGQTPNSGKVP